MEHVVLVYVNQLKMVHYLIIQGHVLHFEPKKKMEIINSGIATSIIPCGIRISFFSHFFLLLQILIFSPSGIGNIYLPFGINKIKTKTQQVSNND